MDMAVSEWYGGGGRYDHDIKPRHLSRSISCVRGCPRIGRHLRRLVSRKHALVNQSELAARQVMLCATWTTVDSLAETYLRSQAVAGAIRYGRAWSYS